MVLALSGSEEYFGSVQYPHNKSNYSTMLDKIQFENGTIVRKEYLNETQKGTSFSSATTRSDYYAEPADSDHSGWKIGQRDKLKDWEIASPREDNQTGVGRLAHDGVVLGWNATTSTVVQGPPALLENPVGSGIRGVYVEAGSVVLSNGEPISWERQFVRLLSSTSANYIFVNESEVLEDIQENRAIGLSVGAELPSISVPHIPLAKLTLSADGTALKQNGDGEVVGEGYVDLRPGVYVGNLNTYPQILRNTEMISDSYTAKSWERVIADTSNGSLIVRLPETPSDSDRVAIVDISGTFDRFPVVIRPGDDTKINGSVDDWIVNIRDTHVELFYHQGTSEWRFEETPGGDCAPVLGAFLSCGGREYIGTKLASECPDGAVVTSTYPDPPDSVYRYEASTSKCYREFYNSVAIYANGQGGLIRVPGAARCNRTQAVESPLVRNIIYVDPSIGDDSISNNGFSESKPFRSIERALIEAVRESRRAGQYNDRYDKVLIELSPGDYYVDNSPGSGSISGLSTQSNLIQRTDTGFKVLNAIVNSKERTVEITVDSSDPSSSLPPRSISLGRILYSSSGGVGNIARVVKDSISSSLWRVTLEYVRGAFANNDDLYNDNLSSINPTRGGLIVPRGVSVNGVDLRKVRVRPMYVPELNPVPEEPQREKTSIFKVTGGSYVSLITFTDNPQVFRSHNTVTSVGFASEAEVRGSSTETSYYSKLNSLFGQFDGWGVEGLEAISAETTIVAPIYDSKNERQLDNEENATGVPLADSRSDSQISYPGAIKLRRGGTNNQGVFDLPDINSVRSSSPYVFNCSVRSIFGLNGLHADGALVSGFKSMVTANFTQVSLQTDPTCFNDNAYYLDPPSNKNEDTGKQYRVSPADPYKYRHFGFKGSNNANIQIVSCFVIGNADHFISESGADLSITNSCSDFGDVSLKAVGYRVRSFSQDEGVPSTNYAGTRIVQIIPPKPLSYVPLSSGEPATLSDTEINTGVVLDYTKTKDWYVTNTSSGTPPSTIRLYVKNSVQSNPFTIVNPPSAKTLGLGQFTYTRKKADGTYELSGGNARPDRKRLFIKGFDENGSSIIYTGDIQLVTSTNSPGYTNLDDNSKIFVWDVAQSMWYVNITTGSIVEETTDTDNNGYLRKKLDYAFRYKIISNPTGNAVYYAQLDFIFDRASITTIRTLDRRKNDDRVYRVVLDGFVKALGIRRPQNFYILEKQLSVSGYPLNGSSNLLVDPLTLSLVRDYDEIFYPEDYKRRISGQIDAASNPYNGQYVAYLTLASQARKVVSGDLYPVLDNDEPEVTEDPSNSITRLAITEMVARPGVHISGSIGPNVDPLALKVRASSTTQGILIGLRRPSVIRASGHTWEWTGYLNYDTAFPTFQGDPLEQEFALGKIIVEDIGGKVYATGMNEEGNFYLGTTVFDLRSGEQYSIPLEADNEPGALTNQVFSNVVVKSSLTLGDGASMFFGNDVTIYFNNDTKFSTITGPITASQNPLPDVYSTTTTAGIVQLADKSIIRGALKAGENSVANRTAVTPYNLMEELTVRFDGSIVAGTGISVTEQSVELPGGDPTDPTDNVTKFVISANEASVDQKGIIEIATTEEVKQFTSSTLAITPATLVQALGDSVKNVVNLRLSLSASSAVPSSDQSGGTLYVHPWNGNEIAFYEPSGTFPRWYVMKFSPSAPVAFSLSSLAANALYDVYLYNSGTIQNPVLAIDFAGWGGVTTPPTRGSLDGIPHKSGDPRRRLVGVIRTTAAGQSALTLGGVRSAEAGDAGPKLYLANLYNLYDARGVFFFGSSWNQVSWSGGWALPPNYGGNAKVSFVQASNTLVTAFLDLYNNPDAAPGGTAAGSIGYVAPGINDMTSPPDDAFYGEVQYSNTTAGSQWARSLVPGLHNIYYLYKQSGASIINEHANHGMIVVVKV